MPLENAYENFPKKHRLNQAVGKVILCSPILSAAGYRLANLSNESILPSTRLSDVVFIAGVAVVSSGLVMIIDNIRAEENYRSRVKRYLTKHDVYFDKLPPDQQRRTIKLIKGEGS